MNMSKKIKPNDLKMIGSTSSSKTDNLEPSASKETGRPSKPKTGQSTVANQLKHKISEPAKNKISEPPNQLKRKLSESANQVKHKISEPIILTKVSSKTVEQKDKARSSKESNQKRVSAATPHELHRPKKTDQSLSAVKSSKYKNSSRPKSSTNHSTLGKRPQFPLNPYAVDPSDPLIQADSLNISSYIGNLFGYSKDRFKDDYLDTGDMESSYANMRREEQRSTKIAKKEDLEEELRSFAELPKKSKRPKNA